MENKVKKLQEKDYLNDQKEMDFEHEIENLKNKYESDIGSLKMKLEDF